MKLTILPGSENYTCQIVQLEKLFPIENADRIQRTIVNAQNVIISKEAKEGDIMAFFPSGSVLSENYCFQNNLFENSERNKNTEVKGFINSKNRIRTIKLKGVISEGMLMPLSSFNVDLKLGDSFTCIDGENIIKKYEIPQNQQNVSSGSKSPVVNKLKWLMIDGQFNFHSNTPHLADNVFKINHNDFAIITEKIHGASAIFAKLLVKKNLNWKEKIAEFFGIDVVSSHFKGIWSSGKPKSNQVKGVEDNFKTDNMHYYNEDIWKQAYDKYSFAIEPGISLYGELCHNTQKGYDYSSLQDFVVYKITRTNSEGIVDIFSWDMVEEYCKKYNLQTVPVLFKGYINTLGEFSLIENNFNEQLLKTLSEKYLEKYCQYCTNKVPNEGICVQVGNNVYKYKSKLFKLYEDKALENNELNIEDNENYIQDSEL